MCCFCLYEKKNNNFFLREKEWGMKHSYIYSRDANKANELFMKFWMNDNKIVKKEECICTAVSWEEFANDDRKYFNTKFRYIYTGIIYEMNIKITNIIIFQRLIKLHRLR